SPPHRPPNVIAEKLRKREAIPATSEARTRSSPRQVTVADPTNRRSVRREKKKKKKGGAEFFKNQEI
ncbi:MAG: hypothetical protein IJQ82_12035, partial [Selenomonadaceae bacterium]|nr:hypothetical protein [Selenomonadaceae bacterium]